MDKAGKDETQGTGFGLIPRPVKISIDHQVQLEIRGLNIRPGAGIDLQWVQRAVEVIRRVTEIEIPFPGESGNGPSIIMRLDPAVGGSRPAWQAKESYGLQIGKDGVDLVASDTHGLFNGIQTLAQLAMEGPDGKWVFPSVKIEDHPRFQWRGYLLDPTRHYRTMAELKGVIDLLAFHKMNVLHLHLVDDQGWRVEILRAPKLVEVGSLLPDVSGKSAPGRFYSQEDIREIVAYASARCVQIVPEIEMPGHSRGATTAYPELSCSGKPEFELCGSKKSTMKFMTGILEEVFGLFPSQFVHIGADEVSPDSWRACPKCRRMAKKLAQEGLPADVRRAPVKVTTGAGRPFHEDIGLVQGHFVRQIDRFISSKKKRMIGWDEILDGGLHKDSNAVPMIWRSWDAVASATALQHDVVVCVYPECYLDNNTPLSVTYAVDPCIAGMPAENEQRILGVQGNMWGEGTPKIEDVYRRTFPRLSALSEVAWLERKQRDFTDFEKRLKQHASRLSRFGVNSISG